MMSRSDAPTAKVFTVLGACLYTSRTKVLHPHGNHAVRNGQKKPNKEPSKSQYVCIGSKTPIESKQTLKKTFSGDIECCQATFRDRDVE